MQDIGAPVMLKQPNVQQVIDAQVNIPASISGAFAIIVGPAVKIYWTSYCRNVARAGAAPTVRDVAPRAEHDVARLERQQRPLEAVERQRRIRAGAHAAAARQRRRLQPQQESLRRAPQIPGMTLSILDLIYLSFCLFTYLSIYLPSSF